jgi:type IV pilus assembly protein PilW
MRTHRFAPLLRQQGFSLVELMVSLVLGGLIIAAVGTVYLGSRQSFRTQDAMARMQEGARYAFEALSVDLRQVGFGCGTVNAGAVDETAGGWYKNLFTGPLRGYKDGSGSPYAADDVDDTDAIWVLRADKANETVITAPGTTDAAHGIGPGGLFVVTDVYSDASVYVASAASGTTYTLGAGTICTTGLVPDSAGFHVLPLSAHFYYIRNNATTGEPGLYRQTLLADGTTEAQEMVEGVEDMEITYGEDITPPGSTAECPEDNCIADVYVDADGVTNWNRVVAVRLKLFMRSPETNVGTGGDGRLHKSFTTTIAVRNRL